MTPIAAALGQHEGRYRAPAGGASITVRATSEGLRLDVQLCLSRDGMRLTAHRPGVFLTPDGRPVVFRDGAVEFSGISFRKAG